MKRITLIFTALNENKEVVNTLKSLYENSNPDLFDVIVIDDGSFVSKDCDSVGWVEIPKKYPCRVVHHHLRQGIQASRTEGAQLAQTQYIGFFNSRMRFEPAWLEKVLEELDKDHKCIFCTTSKILDEKGQHDTKLNGGYLYGATLDLHHDNKTNKLYNHEVLVPKWMYEKQTGTYEIPCVLGAMYFMTKKWFEYIGGFEGLTSYGSDEEFMSLKSWTFGGQCKIISEVAIGNIYRKKKTYIDNIEDFLYNRFYMALVLLPEKEYRQVLNWYATNKYFSLMTLRVAINFEYIAGIKAKYNKLKVNNVLNFIRR